LKDRVISLIARILVIDESKLDTSSGPGLISEWDSLANLSIITDIEEEFNITLELDDILSFTNISDILDTLARHMTKTSESSANMVHDNFSERVIIKGLRQSSNVFTDIESLKNLKGLMGSEVVVVLGSESYSLSIKERIKSLFNKSNSTISFIHKKGGEPNESSIEDIFRQIKK